MEPADADMAPSLGPDLRAVGLERPAHIAGARLPVESRGAVSGWMGCGEDAQDVTLTPTTRINHRYTPAHDAIVREMRARGESYAAIAAALWGTPDAAPSVKGRCNSIGIRAPGYVRPVPRVASERATYGSAPLPAGHPLAVLYAAPGAP